MDESLKTSTTLRSLDLSANPITTVGAKELSEALNTNTTWTWGISTVYRPTIDVVSYLQPLNKSEFRILIAQFLLFRPTTPLS
jgi:hypothetical protein